MPGHTLLLANYTKGFYRAVGWIPTTLPLTPAVAVYKLDELAVAVYKLDELYTMDRNEIDKTTDNITNNKWDNKKRVGKRKRNKHQVTSQKHRKTEYICRYHCNNKKTRGDDDS